MREEVIGRARLILGDCREVLPDMPPADAIVTDPPYGLGEKWQGGKAKWPLYHQDGMEWDAEPVEGLDWIIDCHSHDAIVWGGHLYDLALQRGWLIWDKAQRGSFTSGHCEMAWTTLDQPVRAITLAHSVLTPSHGVTKQHPTQKPLALMRWCLGFLPGARTILDPFMGSGTTGVAAVQMGRDFIGIEREPKYFDIACRRIEEAQRQADLFIPAAPEPKPVQQSLLGDAA